MLHLHYRAYSEVGLVRTSNQDSGYASPTMLMVADGMGGAAAGDLASAIAITFMRDADKGEHQGNAMFGLLDETIEVANTAIADMVETDPGLEGMGTTVCGAMFDGRQLAIAHLGDSRGYLLRDGSLKRLTHDHSWVQSLIDEGRITEEQAASHPHRSLVLKVLNGTQIAQPDHSLLDVQAGDRIMFCSDGLNGMAEDDVLAKALAASDPEDAIRGLVAAAHAGGGYDNITIILADVSTKPPASTKPVSVGSVNDVDFDPDAEATRPMPSKKRTADTVIQPAIKEEVIKPAETARYTPNRRGRGPLLVGALIVIALGILAGAGILITQAAVAPLYYVGAANGKVTIYNGIPDKVGPLSFSKTYRETPIIVADLPPLFQDELARYSYHGQTVEESEETVKVLAGKAEQCVLARRQRERGKVSGAAPTASPTPTTAPRRDEC